MKEIFDWVPWFRELARNIAEGGEAYLTNNAKDIEWGDRPSLLQDAGIGIDPFSFFYFLASKARSKRHKQIYESASHVFEIRSTLPDTGVYEYHIFPTPQSRFDVFCDKENSNQKLLWDSFIEAREGKISPENFENALKLNGVGVVNLTQTLFLINPEHYQPVDNLTDDLSEALELRPPAELEREIKKAGGYEEYLTFLKKLNRAFPGCEPYEINMFLFLRRTGQISVSDRFYHVSTQVHGHNKGDFWDNTDDNFRNYNFKENNWVYTGGPGPGKTWEEKGDYPLTEPVSGDIVLVRTGLRKGRAIGIVQKNDYAKLGVNEDSRIHVLWINKEEEELSTDTRQNAFEKIEPDWNTYAAFKETDAYNPSFNLIHKLTGNQVKDQPETDPDAQQTGSEKMKNQYPLNQILYGPPGTGKTWNTVDYALAIIEDESLDDMLKKSRDGKLHRFNELKADGQIEMVTFHQNYNYEDFIEGIRPVLAGDGEGSVEYELSEGVFREIAKRAEDNKERSEQTGDNSWDTDELLQGFAESIEERLESEEKIKLFPPDKRSGVTIAKIHWSRGSFQSVQLGGTLTDQRLLSKRMIKRDYEAFRRGEINSEKDIKPTYRSKQSYHGNSKYYFALFEKIKEFHDNEWQPDRAPQVKNQNYVLIIDEINRGNIAKIFGELITLIEDSKRIGGDDQATVTLPYSIEEFGVPDNLYIIGTMNTADRSIALLDTALRRRFEFVEMMPDPKLVGGKLDNVDCQKLLEAMNKRIRFLFDREHQIGHTYFMNIDNLESLEKRFKNRILPLLQEYFYDNWEKIDLVLNRNGFIQKIHIESGLFKDSDLIDDQSESYELLPVDDGKWQDPEQYRKIYENDKQDDTGESGEDA